MVEKITPEYKPHIELEKDVTSFLENLGFLVTSSTYHDVMPENIKFALSNIYTPTALYIRGRADRIAINIEKSIVFEWEAKTHSSKKRHDMTLEGLPLCHHIAKGWLGVECLYVYRNPIKKYDRGFWVSSIPKVRDCWIPTNRITHELTKWLYGKFNKAFDRPNIIIRNLRASAGSKDPFVVIDKHVVNELHHWKELILERIK